MKKCQREKRGTKGEVEYAWNMRICVKVGGTMEKFIEKGKNEEKKEEEESRMDVS